MRWQEYLQRQPKRASRHLREDGYPKYAYPSEEAALRSIPGHSGRPRQVLVPYLCPICESWHLGNRPEVGNPHHKADRELALIEVGERATGCMVGENVGTRTQRRYQVKRRAAKALKRASTHQGSDQP